MFFIEERRSEKLPCYTSLFFKMPDYSQVLFDTLVQTSGCVYKDGVFEYPINKLSNLIRLLTRTDEVMVSFIEEIEDKVEVSLIKYKEKPYSHQIDGIRFGLRNNSWLLLDQQGLGKSFQMICLAMELKKRGNTDHCLIVCGVDSLRYNWHNEILKYSDESVRILGQYTTSRGNKRMKTVSDRVLELKNGIDEFFIVTNIATLQNDHFSEAFNKSKSHIGMVVFDEAHHVKSPSSKAAKTLLKMKSEYKIALTGTIILNDPEDAYVPLKWTKNIQCTFSQFKNFYNIYGGFGGVQKIGEKNIECLNDLLSRCSLRRKKDDVLDLPEKTYITEYVEMNDEQQKLYNDVSNLVTQELDLLGGKNISIMQEISLNIRLRQITAFPGILSSTNTQSAKLDRLEELVEQIVSQGDSVVVFNTFKQAAKEEYRRLERFHPVLCTGDCTDDSIEDSKVLFQRGATKVLIATWQKMGTGTTLTAANYCIFVDTPYTSADFEQAADRIHRIGQNKKVFIITLITKDTYDERVQEIVNRKEELSEIILGDREEK